VGNLTDVDQNKMGQRSRTALPCGVLCLSRETQRQGFSSQWPLESQVCFWEGVVSVDSLSGVLTVPFSGLSLCSCLLWNSDAVENETSDVFNQCK